MTIHVPAYQRAWLSWVALTLVGVELAMLFVFSAISIDWSHTGISRAADILLGVATVAFAGSAFGAAQSMWFRTRVHKAGWWIVVTVVSWYCTVGMFWAASLIAGDRFQGHSNSSAILAVFFFTVLFGSVPQWLFLRTNFARAGMWILARVFGWAAGLCLLVLAERLHVFQIGFLFDPDLVFGLHVPFIMAIAVAVAMFGLGFAAVTGAAAVWMQNHPKRQAIGHR